MAKDKLLLIAALVSAANACDTSSTSLAELPKPTMDRVHRSPLLICLHHERFFNTSPKRVGREYGRAAAYSVTAVSDKRSYRLSA